MIPAAIINVLLGVVSWVLGQLPTVSLPNLSSLTSTIGSSGVFTYAAWMNWYFPVDTAVLLVGLRFGWMIGEATWKFVLWALTVTHVLGGTGT